MAEYLSVFVPAVVSLTMATCEAGALLRELSDSEINEIMLKLDKATERYMEKYQRRMMAKGTTLSKADFAAVKDRIQMTIYENAWLLIQQVTEELHNHV